MIVHNGNWGLRIGRRSSSVRSLGTIPRNAEFESEMTDQSVLENSDEEFRLPHCRRFCQPPIASL